MTPQQREALAHLEARIEDYLEKSQRGEPAVSCFLTPGERKQAERYLARRGMGKRCCFWGGYAEAERTCLIVLPPYYEELMDWMPEDSDMNETPFLEDVGEVRITEKREFLKKFFLRIFIRIPLSDTLYGTACSIRRLWLRKISPCFLIQAVLTPKWTGIG